jgi:hypothetical protein
MITRSHRRSTSAILCKASRGLGYDGGYDAVRRYAREWYKSQIADELDEVPWDVLAVCRSLVRRGVLEEGLAQQRELFQ